MRVHAYNWLIDDTNALLVLEAAHSGSFETLCNALYRGLRISYPSLNPAIKVVSKSWYITVINPNLMKACGSPDTPLWFNPNLPEFQSLQDPCLWAAKAIKHLADICDGSALFTFDRLKNKFQLPNSFFFRFLQLRHAFESQFKSLAICLEQDDLEALM